VGDINADGLQENGTSYDHSEGNELGTGWAWGKAEVKDQPTLTTLTLFAGDSAGTSTADLSYNTDTTVNGKLTVIGTDSADENTSSTLKGTQVLTAGTIPTFDPTGTAPIAVAGGTAKYDDWDITKTHSANSVNVNLTLSGGLPTGTVEAKNEVRVTTGHNQVHTIDRVADQAQPGDGTLHSLAKASGSGSTGTTDTVTVTHTGSSMDAVRVFAFDQKGDGKSGLTAGGDLNDLYGHSGKWSATSSGANTVDDKLTVNSKLGVSGWVETGRTFSIRHTDKVSGKYHQEDNGLGVEPLPNGGTQTITHTRDVNGWYNNDEGVSGAPDNAAFQVRRDGSRTLLDVTTNAWSRPDVGEMGTSSSVRDEEHTFDVRRNSTNVNGVETQTYIHLRRVDLESVRADSTKETPQAKYNTHGRSSLWAAEFKDGDSKAGTGARGVHNPNWSWGSSEDKATGQVTKIGSSSPPPVPTTWTPLDWGQGPVNKPPMSTWEALKQDFRNDPGIKWLYNNFSDVARIGFGAIDVGLGVLMTGGTGGLGIVPGAGLMAVGLDQIITGVQNIRYGRAPSVLEYGGYSAARGLGFSEGTSQTVGAFAPAALSLGLNLWGLARLRSPAPGAALEGRPVVELRVGEWFSQAQGWFYQRPTSWAGRWFKFWTEPTATTTYVEYFGVLWNSYRNLRISNPNPRWSLAWIDTQAHEMVHYGLARYAPAVKTWLNNPLLGGLKFAEETLAYTVGHLSVLRLHGVASAPIEALLGSLNGSQRIGAGVNAFLALVLYNKWFK
jgi:hypothetical protein